MRTKSKNSKSRNAFTLIELLIVVGIISILVSLLSVVAANMFQASKNTSEAAAMKSMLQAYSSYATEHNGRFLKGYSTDQDKVVADPNGNPIPWPASGRYVWRLYPYLDNSMHAMYVNDQAPLLSQISGSDCWTYIASLYPSFALNSEWLGGDDRTTASNLMEPFKMYGRSLSDVKHPTKQLVFASAKAPVGTSGGDDDCVPGGISMVMEGYFEMKSPYFPSMGNAWRWFSIDGNHSHTPTSDSGDHGNLSSRHVGNVLAGQLDGSVETLSIKDLADMRRWAPKADAPDWVPMINP